MHNLGWVYEIKQVTIQKFNELRDYTHVHMTEVFDIEISVHKVFERRVAQRSSTDGKPIVRVKTNQLRDLIIREHPEEWTEYLATDEIPNLANFEDESAGLVSLGELSPESRVPGPES